jgi:hypothetical protein
MQVQEEFKEGETRQEGDKELEERKRRARYHDDVLTQSCL